ncbi:ROK family protein [Jonesia denitrificans]|uniref:ROK family protein n=1 Tax=Jonesia denitrificans (strain ATCC 14870 / DSM 20603 / BCRC 15368 / CIP 55.134 / JCM 11481 / NBRC 15587 / NCTC 10816 / Prevot 55134) TaxID=471856 RepID=C7QZ04_JONDD|nr:ROK family protein [Jonesia denitrificans]ACV07912.1 ROK family protein [Jonesia denitrificans DSM 20603]ASE08387.1 sugar kinase [Jonesia denitrificans]QXB42990.1 ROK family protein [Jonesia denitrificans]SQH19885.1 Glucokinase [Jonesia denitrificans]
MAEVVTDILVLALDIGGTNSRGEVLRWGSGTLSEPLAQASLPTPSGDGDGAVNTIITLCRTLLGALDEPTRALVAGIGLGVPGVLDTDRGVVTLASNVGWVNRPICADIEAAVGLPVYLTHDVTAAGAAEQRLGAGRGCDDVIAVFLGTGIAASITSGGHLVTGGVLPGGGRQPAGEIGHLPVDVHGPLCSCGQRGCLELMSSARAIGRRYSVARGVDPDGPDALTSRDVVAALGTDPVAKDVWDDATRYLAHGLLAVTIAVGATRIIMGGGLSQAGRVLTDSVRAHLVEQTRVASVPEIVTAQLGQRAGVLGVALHALDQIV